jgi:hypothetical protein
MRKEYDLQGGRPNPYAKRLGLGGRKKLIERFVEFEQVTKLARRTRKRAQSR